eukprot:comp20431_c0_seq2/m.25949 comp20431_c0_seq2/g.25949  ORF comp20431_c0_seq2/g.25949 comp20431_c0_seq2/m.25949 type:complete len:344 (-) comp20431_c0_seq2:70-1101(-)
MTLFLDHDTTILGSRNMSLHPIIQPLPSYGAGRDHPHAGRHTSLIHGHRLVDVEVVGANQTTSMIDGQGYDWWDQHRSGKEIVTRGRLVEFIESRDIVVSDLTLTNSPMWTLHPYSCHNFTARRLLITAPYDAPNTDGFDPDSCTDVLFEDSVISVGDDGVAIKSGWDCYGREYNRPSANITIRNIVVERAKGSGITIGSEMSGGVSNITIENCAFGSVQQGLRIKSNRHRGGYVRNVVARNVVMHQAWQAVSINDYYGDINPNCPPENNTAIPIIDNISFINIAAHNVSQSAADFKGLPEGPLTNIHMENVVIKAQQPMECEHVAGTFRNVWPAPCREFTRV